MENTGCCSICFRRDRGDDHDDNPKSKWSTGDSRVFAKYGIHSNSAIFSFRAVGRNGEKIGYMYVGNRPEHSVLKCIQILDGFLGGPSGLFFAFAGLRIAFPV